MADLRAATALGLGVVLLLSGCVRAVGREADPRLVRALPVVAPVPPRLAGAVGPGRVARGAPAAGTGEDGWPRPLEQSPGRSEPVTVVVPRAGVNAPVVQVDSELDGSVEVPSLYRANLAGWDRLGPTPGENGSAVILGHLDTKTGPAVFARLSQVRRGDAVVVLRDDGTAVVFRVSAVERVRKAAFPVKKVYQVLPYPAIRLVTCGGRYDFDRHSYEDNLIVYGDFAALYRTSDFLRG
ncbi:hypothetical protein GCM10010517_69840 [Streptosporangium fragile]|uniref:Class F sortase n=1 Tax=Streptosporangium fragile TaxID=46186 RepID=A0ABN3W801_9ACTN